MLIDMHLHEKTFSADSFLSLEQIVTIAREKGLDAVCITDHDSMGLRDYAAEYARKTGFPIFVGVEYYSLQGDITAWGIEEFPDHRIPAQDFINQVREQGGVCVSCHPFRNNKRGLEDGLRRVQGLTGVEVLNGSADMAANRTALAYCKELRLQPIGASDAHTPEQVGKYVTWFPERVSALSDFLAALRNLPLRPAIWNGEGYDVAEEF